MSETAKKNLATHNAIVNMFSTNDFSKIDDYLDANVVDHASMTGHDVKGRDSVKNEMMSMSKMMKDPKSETIKQMADDDWVMAWSKETSTSTVDDPMTGAKAGTTSTVNIIHVSKYKDGKVTEHWMFMNPGDMMSMMPKPPMDNSNMQPKDTTKM